MSRMLSVSRRLSLALVAGLSMGATALGQTTLATPKDPATQAQVQQWNTECLSCHAPGAAKNPPRPGLDLALLSKFATDPAKFAASNHAGMACRTCHVGGYRDYPHAGASAPAAGKAETLQCNECHARQAWHVEAQAAKSVHAKNLSDRFTCSTCHDPHVYTKASKLADPAKIVAQDNGMCLTCHDWDQKFAEYGGKLPVEKKRPDIDAIHAWLPNTRRHWESVRCIECHTPASPTRTLAISHEILSKDRAQRDCVTCHSTNTALRAGLYRYVSSEQADRNGFINTALADRAYVIGATRNTYLDRIGIVLLVLILAGVGLHGLVRVLSSLLRRSGP